VLTQGKSAIKTTFLIPW